MDAPPAIRARGLSFGFGRKPVLDGLDLSVPRGAIYGLLGRNGAGKTTALKLLMGILKPRRGTIGLDGTEVDRVTWKMRRRIGYVSQEQHFYRWMRVRALGAFVGGHYPSWDVAEFETLLVRFMIEPSKRVGELSTGSKMKLAMALALAHRPPVLILDEPTAGVDPVTRKEILDTLSERAAQPDGPTVILSTHNLFEIVNASTWVGILHGGRLRHEGPTSDVQRWFRRVESDIPEGAVALFEDDAGFVARGSPELWATVPSRPASLEDVFYALTSADQR